MDIEEIRQTLESHGLILIEEIGKGGFAKCFKVFSSLYKTHFACKIISLDEKKTMKLQSFRNEIAVLETIIHPNIIQVYKTIETAKYLFLILEYCPNGDLASYIKENGPITNLNKLFSFLKKIVSALLYLEEFNIAHKDIKPSNILIDKYYRSKLADFGLSKKLVEDGELIEEFTGSLAFVAPEIITGKAHNPIKADIWSFGVTVYYLAIGRLPFPHKDYATLFKSVSDGQYIIPEEVDPFIEQIINGALNLNPEKRMSFQQMLKILNEGNPLHCSSSNDALPTLKPGNPRVRA